MWLPAENLWERCNRNDQGPSQFGRKHIVDLFIWLHFGCRTWLEGLGTYFCEFVAIKMLWVLLHNLELDRKTQGCWCGWNSHLCHFCKCYSVMVDLCFTFKVPPNLEGKTLPSTTVKRGIWESNYRSVAINQMSDWGWPWDILGWIKGFLHKVDLSSKGLDNAVFFGVFMDFWANFLPQHIWYDTGAF